MDSYPDRPLPARPRPKPIASMTEQELTEMLTKSRNFSDIIPALIEYVFRQNQEIQKLQSKLEQQNKPACRNSSAKKSGRIRKEFYFTGKLLTDEDIAYYVEGNYLSITALERDVGAKKNQLRNRYKRYKQQQKQVKEESNHGNNGNSCRMVHGKHI